MGEPKRFLTRLPLAPKPKHNQRCVGSTDNTGDFPEVESKPEMHGFLNPRHGGWEPWGSCVEARGGRTGGERFVRESFIPRGVRRKTWSFAARSVSNWGGWFISLVLTEKHQRSVDT